MCSFVWMHKVFVVILVSFYYKIHVFPTIHSCIYVNVYINIYKQYVKHNINFARYGDGCQDYPEPGNSSGE